MKYELKATARYFLPIYLAILTLSLIIGLRGVNETFLPFLNFLLPTILGLSFMGLMVMTVILIVTRFDKNLLGDEGYLMFTLPTKVTTLIHAKLLSSMLWILLSGLIFLLSILFITFRHISFLDLRILWDALPKDYMFLLLLVLLTVVGILQSLLQVYASLSIAQSYSITKNRVLGGILVFIVISMAFNIFESVVSLGGTFFFRESPWLQMVMDETMFQNIEDIFQFFKSFMTVYLVYTSVKAVLFYFFTKYHLEKKLNLD